MPETTETTAQPSKPKARRRTLEERLAAAKEEQRKKQEEQKKQDKVVRSLAAKIENKKRKENDRHRTRRLVLLGLTFSLILEEDPDLLKDTKDYVNKAIKRDEPQIKTANKKTAAALQKNVRDCKIIMETLGLIEAGRPLTEPIQAPPLPKAAPAQEPEDSTETPEPEADQADSPKP